MSHGARGCGAARVHQLHQTKLQEHRKNVLQSEKYASDYMLVGDGPRKRLSNGLQDNSELHPDTSGSGSVQTIMTNSTVIAEEQNSQVLLYFLTENQ